MIVVAVVLLFGVALRLFSFSRSAVEHFDEGVYASNMYFGPPDYAYPQQRFFAPPLLPALIEAGMIAGVPPNVAALLPNLLAGCATIVALWWLGRSWFGPEVGLSAATLLALSDFHVIFSATALTDALLSLWLILALDAISRSLGNTDFRWATGAGIYTGLAWWTKYNGWLPLAIEAAALPLLWVLLRPSSKQLWKCFACFGLTVIVGMVVWCPYYFSLQSQGGYEPIAANHAKYFVGFAGWFDAVSRQIANQYVIEGPWSKLAVTVAIVLPQCLAPQSFRRISRALWQAVGIGSLALFLTTYFVVVVFAIVACIRALLVVRRTPKLDETWRRRAVGLSIVVAWCAILMLATPLYTPYPRLALPALVATCLGAALNSSPYLIADFPYGGGATADWKKMAAFYAFVLGTCVFCYLCLPHIDQPELAKDRQGIERIAKQIHQVGGGDAARVIYVYGEPALLFQLRAAGEEFVAPVQDVPDKSAMAKDKPVPTFLLVGPNAAADPQFREQWESKRTHWELLRAFDYMPSPIVWLDLHDPRVANHPATADHAIRLYQFQP